jgi:hypothetical protein
LTVMFEKPQRLETLTTRQRLVISCAGVLLAFSLLVGCTKACTAVGATSGVTFDLSQITAGRGHVHVRACVERSCVARVASAPRLDRSPSTTPFRLGVGSSHPRRHGWSVRLRWDDRGPAAHLSAERAGLPSHRLRGDRSGDDWRPTRTADESLRADARHWA